MRNMKSAQEICKAKDPGCQYAGAFGSLKASVEILYEFDLDKAKTLDELKRAIHNSFDKYMEEK